MGFRIEGEGCGVCDLEFGALGLGVSISEILALHERGAAVSFGFRVQGPGFRATHQTPKAFFESLGSG